MESGARVGGGGDCRREADLANDEQPVAAVHEEWTHGVIAVVEAASVSGEEERLASRGGREGEGLVREGMGGRDGGVGGVYWIYSHV
jgi:hypothetical protein